MNNKIKCINCKYCKECGRTTKQYFMPIGRKIYKCNHPKVYELKDKQRFPQNNFIGYGDMTIESPLQLKTRKKFCPLEGGKYE